MHRAALLLLALIIGAAAWAEEAQGNGVVLVMAAGEVRGTLIPDGGAKFLGIPFAEPPVGELRWRPPVAPGTWQGIRDATKFGSPCAQTEAGEWNRVAARDGVEDCLYLNVITPQWPPKRPLPVMVWIHGGGNNAGTASTAFFNDGTLARHGIVLVTLNYRLGVFGFLAHPQLTRASAQRASGNYALLDQIAALSWVRRNIAAFGGDANNVTIFGQSAGALNVGLLMTSPLARGLLQRAIAQSGTVLFDIDGTPLAKAEQEGARLAALVGAPEEDPIPTLRKISAGELLSAVARSGATGGQELHIGPVIDGWVIPRAPVKVFSAGEAAPVPFMLGYNARELGFPAPPEEQRRRLADSFGSLAPQAWKLYGLTDGEEGHPDPLYGPLANQIAADIFFRCPAALIAAWHSRVHQQVYVYQFERAIPGQENAGAVHSAELPYVFGNFPISGNLSGPFTQEDFRLADQIQAYWTAFARSADPNHSGAPHWPEFSRTAAQIRFTADARVMPQREGVRRPFCRLYGEGTEQRLQGR